MRGDGRGGPRRAGPVGVPGGTANPRPLPATPLPVPRQPLRWPPPHPPAAAAALGWGCLRPGDHGPASPDPARHGAAGHSTARLGPTLCRRLFSHKYGRRSYRRGRHRDRSLPRHRPQTGPHPHHPHPHHFHSPRSRLRSVPPFPAPPPPLAASLLPSRPPSRVCGSPVPSLRGFPRTMGVGVRRCPAVLPGEPGLCPALCTETPTPSAGTCPCNGSPPVSAVPQACPAWSFPITVALRGRGRLGSEIPC